MLMSSTRILEGLQDILLSLKDQHPEAITKAELMVGELIKRENLTYFCERYRAGHALLSKHLSEFWSLDSRLTATISERLAALPLELSPYWNLAKIDDDFQQLSQCVLALARAAGYRSEHGAALNEAVSDLLAWDVAGSKLYEATASPSTDSSSRDMNKPEHVQRVMREFLPAYEDVEILNFRQIAGGLSKTTIFFDAKTSRFQTEPLVLRGDSLLPILDQVYVGMDLRWEYYLLRYLFRAGICVPEPLMLFAGDAASKTGFFVSRRVSGQPRGDYLLRIQTFSPDLTHSISTEMARLHKLRVDINDVDLHNTHLVQPDIRTRTQAVRAFLLRNRSTLESYAAPVSIVACVALDWLLENIPPSDEPPCIVHRDAGLNNILTDDDSVSAIIDWETADLGDPAEDIVWLPFLTGGAIDLQRFLDGYEQAGGCRPSAFAQKYYGILARFRILIAAIDLQVKYQNETTADTILCAAGLGQTYKVSADLDAAIRKAIEASV